MSTISQYDARGAAERASLVRWYAFADQVSTNIERMAADVLDHQRLVIGGSGEHDYVCCTHPVHGHAVHWTERQSWPCPELLRVAAVLDIDVIDSIEAQRQLDELAYGPPLTPAERRERWEEALPPTLRSRG